MAPRWLCQLAVIATITVVAQVPSATAHAAAAVSAAIANEAGAQANKGDVTRRMAKAGGGEAELAGPLPVTAAQAGAGALSCTDWATGPYADQDLWRFRLGTGTFVSVVLGFLDGDGVRTTRTVEAIDSGTAWIATPAGWSLVSGTAVVTGGAGDFELARACPAAGVREPAMSGLAPVAVGRAAGGPRPANVQDAKTAPRSLAADTDIAATVTVGASLVLVGLLLLIVRRRPRGRHRMREAR